MRYQNSASSESNVGDDKNVEGKLTAVSEGEQHVVKAACIIISRA